MVPPAAPAVAIPRPPLPMMLQPCVVAFPRRTPVAIYNRATAYESQHSNHWIHNEFSTPTQKHAWALHGHDALLFYHHGHPGDPAYARELTALVRGRPETGGWACSAWGSVMRRPLGL